MDFIWLTSMLMQCATGTKSPLCHRLFHQAIGIFQILTKDTNCLLTFCCPNKTFVYHCELHVSDDQVLSVRNHLDVRTFLTTTAKRGLLNWKPISSLLCAVSLGRFSSPRRHRNVRMTTVYVRKWEVRSTGTFLRYFEVCLRGTLWLLLMILACNFADRKIQNSTSPPSDNRTYNCYRLIQACSGLFLVNT